MLPLEDFAFCHLRTQFLKLHACAPMNMNESVTGGTVLKDTEMPYGVQFSLTGANLFARSIKKVKDTEAPYRINSVLNATILSEGLIESFTSPL